jgi:hypothetical protein
MPKPTNFCAVRPLVAFGSPRGVFQGGELIAAGQGDWIRPTTSGLLLETDIVRAGRHVSKVPGTEVATTFMCMHYRWPRCVDDRSRSIRQEPIVGTGAYAIPVTVDRVLAGCLLEFLFESQAIPETQLTSLGADNDEISRHRIYGRSRHRAGLVEMVRVGCGRGDHGPSAQ